MRYRAFEIYMFSAMIFHCVVAAINIFEDIFRGCLYFDRFSRYAICIAMLRRALLSSAWCSEVLPEDTTAFFHRCWRRHFLRHHADYCRQHFRARPFFFHFLDVFATPAAFPISIEDSDIACRFLRDDISPSARCLLLFIFRAFCRRLFSRWRIFVVYGAAARFLPSAAFSSISSHTKFSWVAHLTLFSYFRYAPSPLHFVSVFHFPYIDFQRWYSLAFSSRLYILFIFFALSLIFSPPIRCEQRLLLRIEEDNEADNIIQSTFSAPILLHRCRRWLRGGALSAHATCAEITRDTERLFSTADSTPLSAYDAATTLYSLY